MRCSSHDPSGLIEPTADRPAPAHRPERRCVLTGESRDRAGLVRLVIGPDGQLWPDLAARLPGRGAWVTPDARAIADAVASGRLARAAARTLKAPVIVPQDLVDRIGEGLMRRTLDRLGLERRAGHLVFGFERLVEQARAGRLVLLLHAGDAADDGVARLDQAFRSGGGDMRDVLRLPADRHALSRAVGRENMVHSGVSDGRAAARIRGDAARWLAFLGTTEGFDGHGRDACGREDEGRR